MKTLSMVVAVPLTVMAYNITMKMDSRNIDQLINAVVIAVIILAVVIPSGLYILAYVRARTGMAELAARPRQARPMAPAGWGYGAPAPAWNSQPPMLTAQPTQPVGTFAVQPPAYEFHQEDWS